MCGIAGYKSARGFDPATVEAMVSALRHRGPDSSGFHDDGDYHAGMCRLSINDLSGGDQPLYSADRSVVLLYNGEIYNYRELRRGLEAKGYLFRSDSDGEVIPFLYREHGEDLFELLDGMFAVALWIADEKQADPGARHSRRKAAALCRAGARRDRVRLGDRGLKPFPGIDLSLDRQALWDFPTFLWIPEPRTVYRGIKALPRAHILIADDNGTRLKRYDNRFNPRPAWPGSRPAWSPKPGGWWKRR